MNRLFLSLLLAGCGSGGTSGTGNMPEPDTTKAEGDITKYVVSQLIAPTTFKECSIDLNGDGAVDNQLGNIMGALASQGGFDPQTAINDSVKEGSALLLVSLQTKSTSDATNVGVSIYLARSMKMPDFGGMGMFTVDNSQAPANFFGTMKKGKFSSNNPATTKTPATVTINLPLTGGAPLILKLNGAHVNFNYDGGKLTNGQLHGSIKKADIDKSIIPTVATLLSDTLAKGCGGGGGDGGAKPDGGMPGKCEGSAGTIKMVFDTGMCKNADGSMAQAGDLKIDICEVAENPLIVNVLAPDIQVFDSAGNYAPNKMKNAPNKDSLSLGICWSGTGAKF